MNARDDYEITNIGAIPREWDLVTLDEVATDFVSGGTPSTSKAEYWNGKIPWMKSAWISTKTVDTGERYISKMGLENSATHIIPKGNILIATRVCIGNVAVNTIDIAISQDLTGVVIDKAKADPDFIYWSLKKSENRIKRLVQGSTIKGILKEDLKALQIALPSLFEQRRISSVLSSVDEAIQKTDKIISKTRQLKKGLMQQLLSKGIGHIKFKQTEIGEIPEEWEVMKLSQMIEMGFVIYHLDGNHGELYPREVDFAEQGIPFLSANVLVDGQIDFQKAKYLTITKGRQLTKGIAQDGDVLLAHNATVGPVGVLKTNLPSVILGTTLTCYRCNPKLLSNWYLRYYMESSHFQRQLQRIMKQTTRNQVPITAQKNLYFALPTLDEQNRIASILLEADNRKEIERHSRRQLEKLKRGLMQVLLSGRVRVKVN